MPSRGLPCLACAVGRLVVTNTRRVAAALTVRYRRCKACRRLFRCEERIVPCRSHKKCTSR